jgi:hypothetical protein
MRYVYSVIRFVPNTARGEFVNIGAIVGSDEANDWIVRQVGNMGRARKLGDARVLDGALAFLNRIDDEVDAHNDAVEQMLALPTRVTEEWLIRMWGECNNTVQFSQPAPIEAADAGAAMEVIFQNLILDPASRRYPLRSKHTILAAMRGAYRGAGILAPARVSYRPLVHGLHHSEPFDFVVANGRAVQLAQAWSFTAAEADEAIERVKAWAWTVQDIRDGGGRARTQDDREFVVPENVEVVAVYAEPEAANRRQVIVAEALSAFGKANVEPVTLENAAEVGRRAARLLGAANG